MRSVMKPLCAMAVFLGPAAAAAGAASAARERLAPQPPLPIYTKDNGPATPRLEELKEAASVTQYGITWTFDKPARIGQFVNGDYYVVGPTVIKSVDPKPILGKDVPETELDEREKRVPEADRIRNGSMINPPFSGQTALDSGVRRSAGFDRKLLALAPIGLKPGDVLLSSISLKQGEQSVFVYHSGGPRQAGDNCPVRVAALLSCVAEPLPADAFRPAYCDRARKIYLARNLERELLPRLARAPDSPDPVKFAEVFRKPWFNTAFFGFEEPMENMPHYGQWVGQAVGNAGLVLCFDYRPEEKERLLVNFVQVGIDYWGLVRAGKTGWVGWGGHGSGRKFPIVLAGHLLGDDEMASPTRAFPKVEFGEDNQTAYGDSWTGAKVVFAGHSGILAATGKVDPRRSHWGPYEHLTPEHWQENGLNGTQSEAYRRANTSCCWVAEALALRILRLEKHWNHDAFFDYVDRWMTEEDTFLPTVNKQFKTPMKDGPPGSFGRQGYTGDRWVRGAWEKYRSLSSAPTDGWKQKHDDSCYRGAIKDMETRRPKRVPQGSSAVR